MHRLRFILSALALLCLTAAPVSLLAASNDLGKSFVFSTDSEEARQQIEKFVRAIETFQPPSRGLEIAQKAVEADPQFAFAHYAVGVMTPQPAEAQAHFKEALQLAENASEGEREYIRAMSLVRTPQPDIDQALEIFSKLRRDYPGERMVAMLLGQLYSNQGKVPEALEAFEAAARIDSSTPRVHSFIGNIHLVRGDYEEARKLYSKAREMAPPDSAPFFPYVGPVFAALYEGRVDSALKHADAYLEKYEKSGAPQTFPAVFIWNMKARINLEHNRTEEALRCYEKGAETLESSTLNETQKKTWMGRYYHGKARVLAKMGRQEEAGELAAQVQRMIEEGGEQGQQFLPALHYLLAYLDLESGNYSKAVEHLTKIEQPDPFQLALLGRAYEKLGQHEKAVAAYQSVLDSNVNSLERALALREARNKLAAIG